MEIGGGFGKCVLFDAISRDSVLSSLSLSLLVSAILGRSRPFPAVLGIIYKNILKRPDQRFVDDTLICVELVFKSVPRWGCPAKARRSTLVMIPSF